MGAIWLPTLAGIGRMIPVATSDSVPTVGANWSLVVYTVPTGRGAWITSAYMNHDSGLAPTLLIMALRNAAAATLHQPIRRATFTQDNIETMRGSFFMAEGDDIRFAIVGGDATTDMEVGIAGVEYDWVDVI